MLFYIAFPVVFSLLSQVLIIIGAITLPPHFLSQWWTCEVQHHYFYHQGPGPSAGASIISICIFQNRHYHLATISRIYGHCHSSILHGQATHPCQVWIQYDPALPYFERVLCNSSSFRTLLKYHSCSFGILIYGPDTAARY